MIKLKEINGGVSMSKDIPGGGGFPLEVRKSLLILGVSSDGVTVQVVIEAWKKQIVKLTPDKGGDTETAIILNTAKDCVVNWLDRGGGSNRGPNQPSPVPLRPHPSAGDNVVMLPLPESSNDDDEI
jgi:hypothetical protein